MKTLADFKRAVALKKPMLVRWNERPDEWKGRLPVKVQSNSVAFFREETVPEPSMREVLLKAAVDRPHSNASWHWWHQADHYRASPDTPNAIRVLIGGAWDEPSAGWMEYRMAD